MKLLLAMTMLTMSSLGLACTNFSGTYQVNDEVNQISQNGCSTITMITPQVTATVVVDGSYHQTLIQDIVVEGQVLGKVTLSHRASFGIADLALDTKAHFEMMGQVQDQETKSVNTLNAAGDLVSVSTFEDGHTETTIAKKLK